MELLDVGRVVLGLVLLILGGEGLVRGASALALRIGLSSLVVGLVIVSAATSAPELSVTVGAVLDGQPDLAVGNVVGSNIANVLLVLGFAALLVPLAVKRRLVRFDLPVMVGITVLFLLLALDGEISRLDGTLLFVAVSAHIVLSFTRSRKDPEIAAEQAAETPDDVPGTTGSPARAITVAILFVVGGVGLLVLGAQLLVTGASGIATALGVSGLVVGLTVVAIGTSLPELATSVIAIRRGEGDLAVGNVVGSNIFNIGIVLGLPAMLFPDGIPVPGAALALDIPLMLAASVALLPIAFTGFRVNRWEGATFLGLYGAFVVYLVLGAADHDALDGFTTVMAGFVLPLLALTLLAVTTYEIGLRRGRRQERERSSPG